MRALKLIALCLLGALVLNVLSWALYGRSSALLLTASDFDGWGALTGEQTLHLYASLDPVGLSEWREAGDFPPWLRQRLMRLYVESGRAVRVEYYPVTWTGEPDDLEECHLLLGALVYSRPLYARTLGGVYGLGFASDRHREWVWVFGWRSLGYGGYSVS